MKKHLFWVVLAVMWVGGCAQSGAPLGAGANHASDSTAAPTTLPLTKISATAQPQTTVAAEPQPIEFEKQTLANGLRVLYVPLHNAPVVHVRVMYHVGSRDEREDRQGFAHMFEHMMFRGSAHVAPEEHMKRINGVGGISNAFTSFDQTTYVNTVPANQVELPLYMEADRMASFKVSDKIYQVERNVVAKEWGIRQNKPYGTMWEDFLGNVFSKHSYRWTPIGNMDHLKNASADELQAFFNKYYVPNNAVLVVAGDFDKAKIKPLVEQYYGWIPRGDDVKRDIRPEPVHTQAKAVEVKRMVPQQAILIGYPLPGWGTPDQYALELLGSVVGDGRTGRLPKRLVLSEKPLCTDAGGGPMILQDAGLFTFNATILQGKSADEVSKILKEEIATLLEKGVTQEELDRAKMGARKALVTGRSTCEQLARNVGEEELFGNNAAAANEEWDKINAQTPADLLRVARQYLVDEKSTTLRVTPDTPAAARAAAMANREKVISATAPVAQSSQPIQPRTVSFPASYPTTAPAMAAIGATEFKKGEEISINGVRVIVMTDHRLPIVTWNLAMRSGSHAEPATRTGLGQITASMVRRGSTSTPFEALNEDLESRGIDIELHDMGDNTRLSGSCLTDQIDHAISRSREILLQPAFPVDELEKLREQTIAQIISSRDNPSTVADIELTNALFGQSVLGRQSTPETLKAITLDDVKSYYRQVYVPNDAVLILAGDIDVPRGQQLARTLLDGWASGSLPQVDYTLPGTTQRRVVLIDNPAAKQSVLQMGVRSYDIRSDDKFAGSLIGQILSHGIESRLGKYVRAEKGYAYGVFAVFQPTRQAGSFEGTTETKFETTGPCIEAMFKVFNDMRTADVTPAELQDAKQRVAGAMVMETQTIQKQAGRRMDAILNGYPADYYDKYPARLAQVPAADLRTVMNKYVQDSQMNIIVVAPVEKVKSQLEQFGAVEVLPMPNQRSATTQPSSEMMK